ncbi:MAG TPA: 3-oxo-tetronate kinase [Burkholderiales bacterium]|nr:3-oxo-tetronate kinase [Burkholderiales bacterium]
MRLGCIADDLTGATDLGVTLAREGLSVIQVNGVPGGALDLAPSDAIVVALKSRTNPAAEAVQWSLASLAWLHARGAERIYFKYCSTFDSTPRGNIGPVADALLDALGEHRTVATPAYPRNGRTVYKGNLFVGDVPLAESGMKDHPLTPMRDSSLVRVLAAQTRRKVSLIPCEVMDAGASAIRARLEGLSGFAILDAVRDEHLVAAGEACRDMKLTTGGAGLAMGIARALGVKRRSASALPRVAGAAVVLAGSCSQATLRQIAAFGGPAFRIQPERIDVDAAVRFATQNGDHPLIYASAPPEGIVPGKGEAIEHAFRQIARELARQGVRKFVVAGGETSGAVVEALGVRALAIGPEIDPGVPWTAAQGGEPYLLALKSGNFGSPEFFAKALEMVR